MKNFVFLFCIFCLCNCTINAQDLNSDSPLYDRAEELLMNIDTIPDYRSKKNKLKLTGTIYKADGVTPASDVILFIEQPNEDGDFELRKTDDSRYVLHRSWVKTGADGTYTIYTFVPGNDRRYNQLQQIFPLVKEPTKPVYELETFLFDEDPLLTKRCRKRIEKKSDVSRILKLKEENGLLVAQRDIVLNSDKEISK
jgi:protocatechuate 3,4-dioxygenase beta subunit